MTAAYVPFETLFSVSRRAESPESSPTVYAAPSITGRGALGRSGEFKAVEPRIRPTLSPTVAPLGHERLIGVRSILNHDVEVTGGATGRRYHFAAGQSREIPLSDARLLVAQGEFGFSGGR